MRRSSTARAFPHAGIGSPGMETEGSIIVVTGAAGGIGGALVRGLLDRGARTVVATDLDGDGVERLAAEVGDRVVARVLDVGDEAATRALVEDVEDTIGPIDAWFANA